MSTITYYILQDIRCGAQLLDTALKRGLFLQKVHQRSYADHQNFFDRSTIFFVAGSPKCWLGVGCQILQAIKFLRHCPLFLCNMLRAMTI